MHSFALCVTVPTLGIRARRIGLAEARTLLGRLVEENLRQMREAAARGAPLPLLYVLRPRYERETVDVWRSAREIIARKREDCEGLAAYRVAELLFHGRPARVVLRLHPSQGLVHVVARHEDRAPGHRDEDPSRFLGM